MNYRVLKLTSVNQRVRYMPQVYRWRWFGYRWKNMCKNPQLFERFAREIISHAQYREQIALSIKLSKKVVKTEVI